MKTLLIFSSGEYGRKIQFGVMECQEFAVCLQTVFPLLSFLILTLKS